MNFYLLIFVNVQRHVCKYTSTGRICVQLCCMLVDAKTWWIRVKSWTKTYTIVASIETFQWEFVGNLNSEFDSYMKSLQHIKDIVILFTYITRSYFTYVTWSCFTYITWSYFACNHAILILRRKNNHAIWFYI